MCLAVFQVALLFRRNGVVVTGGGKDGNLHSSLNTALQVYVFVKRHIRPVVNQLDDVVLGTDTVNTAEALNDADRIPVDIVVDEVVAVLQVLAFGDTVRSDENFNLFVNIGIDGIFFLGNRRE